MLNCPFFDQPQLPWRKITIRNFQRSYRHLRSELIVFNMKMRRRVFIEVHVDEALLIYDRFPQFPPPLRGRVRVGGILSMNYYGRDPLPPPSRGGEKQC